MDECYLCHGLRGHNRLKTEYADLFNDELTRATIEVDRLESLMKDVNWYNFEVRCFQWRHPWPQTWGDSKLTLSGSAVDTVVRNGRNREVGRFPIWFSGYIRDAPHLPAEIILSALNDAICYKESCAEQATAPFDWAPGGSKYEQLKEDTLVGR